MMKLKGATAPAFFKFGVFGDTGSGKTYTAAKIMAQFAAKYCPGKHVAMFDTEPAAGFVSDMVREITGKELLVCESRSFSALLDFCDTCRHDGHIAIVDSITHPWRSLMADYLDAKRSRCASAGGNQNTVKLSLKDWGPIKDMWGRFTEKYCYDPVHWCMCGREGDRWENVEDDEGNEEMRKTGVKMKTETETGYEPSLLVQMVLEKNHHYMRVCKDRFDAFAVGTMSGPEPDIDFCLPFISRLSLGGNPPENATASPVFDAGSGRNYETIRAQREGLLENIKDDILLALPGADAASKKAKVTLLRETFGTSSWTELEKDENKYSVAALTEARAKMAEIIRGKNYGASGE
jgi:hypothetical protein